MERVVVTGMGVLTAAGDSPEAIWRSCLDGRTGIRRIARYDASGCVCQVGAEIAAFPRPAFPVADALLARCNPYHLGMIHCVHQALGEADLRGDRGVGLVLGSNNILGRVHAKNGTGFREWESLMDLPSVGAGVLAQVFGIQEAVFAVDGASASTSLALGLAARLVRHGVLERVVAGGGDVCVLRAFVEDLTDAYIVHGEDLHRPFSLLKNKRVLGDACGAVVLEGLAAARRRGARPLAELSGFGSFSGGAGLEFPEAEPYARAIRAALADAALEPADVTCAMAHAGATRFGDLVEARSLFDALYEGGRNPVPVTAITPNFGYTCGATGVLEAVVAIQMIARGAVPPILGLRKARNKYVDRMNLASRAIRGPVRSVITCSYGVGGTYASLAFSEAPRG